MNRKTLGAILYAAISVGGCAAYEASPITDAAVTEALRPVDRTNLQERAAAIHNPLLHFGDFDPETPLTPRGAAVLAVLNHPSLRSERSRSALADAQLLQAGVLPNPSLTFQLDAPVGKNTKGEVIGYGLGIDWEFTALISRGAKLESARAASDQVRLDVAWKEWQVAQAAKQAAYDVVAVELREKDAVALSEQLDRIADKMDAALAHHDLKANDAAAARAAADDARVILAGIRRDATDTRLALNHALGLAADTKIVLSTAIHLPDSLAVNTAEHFVANLENRRIDLVALRRGYDAQEATVRAAILSQFPKISLGIAHTRDTGDFFTLGPSLSMELPFFDRNQGNIAIEKATRQQLFNEYVSRVFDARSEVAQSLATIRSLNDVIAAQRAQVESLRKLVNANEQALTQGDLDAATFYAAAVSLSQKQNDLTSLKQDLVHAQLRLELATGAQVDLFQTSPSTLSKDER